MYKLIVYMLFWKQNKTHISQTSKSNIAWVKPNTLFKSNILRPEAHVTHVDPDTLKLSKMDKSTLVLPSKLKKINKNQLLVDYAPTDKPLWNAKESNPLSSHQQDFVLHAIVIWHSRTSHQCFNVSSFYLALKEWMPTIFVGRKLGVKNKMWVDAIWIRRRITRCQTHWNVKWIEVL